MGKLSEDEKWYRVSLRLMGDKLPAEKIETILGIIPSSLGIKGRAINNKPNSDKYFTNIWTLKSGTISDVSFDEQISSLLDLLEPKLINIKQILSFPNVKGELFLGSNAVENQVESFLSASLLKRITDMGLTIDLDLY